ncbi:head protein [Vagococcus salmoninarum]|uniref:head protein n=1 Tax=Vagococcus salmoninarum TaxID=2739 RepID=UPI00187F1F3A|nr:head protein [Vagococcus salmoninarum]MBE9390017.1 head protein [Vagococcus salmoninarum]
MANEITKLLDAITPEQYTTYTNTKAEEHSAFIQSGILVPTPNLDQMIVAGGKLVTMPEWSKTSLTDQVLEEDTALETGKVGSKSQIAPVLYRGTGAAYTDLVAIIAGSNPVTQILNDFADYTLESDQQIMQNIIKALFAKGTGVNKGVLLDSHVSDQSTARAAVISPEMVIDARSILGTSRSKLTIIALHSKVKAELEKQNVQTKHYIPASDSKSGFDTYLGMRVVEDDSLVADGTGVYETYLYAAGSFGKNTATPADMVTYEPDRDKAKGNNMLYVRRARVIHPFGLKFKSETVSGVTPTNADLALARNWEKVHEDKKIGLICIRHKISADLTEVTPPTGG